MLTKKELELVNYKGISPDPGEKYSLDSLKKIKDSLDQYIEYYKDRKYEITFSNGETTEFEIEEYNLAHMIGIKKDILINVPEIAQIIGTPTKPKTYALLEKIVEDPKTFIQLNKKYNFDLLNYYRINVRNQVFQRFSNFYDLNFGCINFDE